MRGTHSFYNALVYTTIDGERLDREYGIAQNYDFGRKKWRRLRAQARRELG